MKLKEAKELEKTIETLLHVAVYLEAQGITDTKHKPYLDQLASDCRQGCSAIGKVIY